MSNNPGDMVRISAAFTDADGDPADPTTVTVRVRMRRSGEEATEYAYDTDDEVVRDSAGNYHLDYEVPALPANHRGMTFEYEWQGEGAVTAVEQGTFHVSDAFG
jgi:hypothetical protein